MKKIFSFSLICICIFLPLAPSAFAKESQDELKAYLSGMNRIAIEVDVAMRNLSINILQPKNAMEQIASSIEKFEVLKAPSIFSTDHDNMLSAFRLIREGLKLLSEGEREESTEMVRKGAALLKNAAMNMRTIAEEEGLIPARERPRETTKPILPPPAPTSIAGTSPTLSPHIASPQVESDFMSTETGPSPDIILSQEVDSSPILIARGEIVSIEPKDGHFVVELKDDSGRKIELDINPGQCTIMRDNNLASITQIEKGLSSYALYIKKEDKNQARFIAVFQPENANPPIFKKPAR